MRRFCTLSPKATITSPFKVKASANELVNWTVTPPRPVPDHIVKTPYHSRPDGRMPPSNKGSGHKYDQHSVSLLRKNAKVVAAARLVALRASQVGVSTDDVDAIVHDYMISRGVCPAGINFWNFPKTLCASVNEIVCHGVPNKRPLMKGDIATYDVTCWSEGFFGDNAGCALVGDDETNPFPELRTMVHAVRESVETAVTLCVPGAPLSVVGDSVTATAKKYGLSLSDSFHGHFIGEEMHMRPLVPAVKMRFGSQSWLELSTFKLEPGHCFTIEPIFMEKGASGEVHTLDDGWSAASVDGKKGCQWEHMITIHESGPEILTQLTEEEEAAIPFKLVDELVERCREANKDLIREQEGRIAAMI